MKKTILKTILALALMIPGVSAAEIYVGNRDYVILEGDTLNADVGVTGSGSLDFELLGGTGVFQYSEDRDLLLVADIHPSGPDQRLEVLITSTTGESESFQFDVYPRTVPEYGGDSSLIVSGKCWFSKDSDPSVNLGSISYQWKPGVVSSFYGVVRDWNTFAVSTTRAIISLEGDNDFGRFVANNIGRPMWWGNDQLSESENRYAFNFGSTWRDLRSDSGSGFNIGWESEFARNSGFGMTFESSSQFTAKGAWSAVETGNEDITGRFQCTNYLINEEPNGTILTPTDDANTGQRLPEGQLAVSKWKHSFYRFDLSGVKGGIGSATFRVYYEEENAPTFYIGAVDNDDWTENSVLPGQTFIHDDPSLQLANATATGSGYVEFNVTDFVSSQIVDDGIVTLELSANTGAWSLVSSREGGNPPELLLTPRSSSVTITPTDDANAGYLLPEGQQAASKWKHSFYRFDVSGVEGDISNATFRVYYEEENAPTFFIGAVENDDWTEDGALPERTLIHDDPAKQLASVSVTGSGYVEFNVTNFVASQISSDGIVTLELSANTGGWNIISSRESDNPPELIIPTTSTTSNLTDDANTGFALPGGQLASSKWKHSFFRFDISGIQGDFDNATFRVYYEEENTPTFYIGAVNNDDWTEDGVLPERTLIHDDPALQLANATVTGSGYVEFNVTNFVASQISSDGIVTLELSANTGGWNIISSSESDNPPELLIDADVINTTAPVVNITFPTARSLTEGNTVTVRGTASDQNGVANIQVNGQNATSSDGFLNWSIVVELSPGLNTLTVAAIDNNGNRNNLAAQIVIDSRIPLPSPRELVLDSANNRVLVLSSDSIHAILAVDLDTGLRSIISDNSTPDATNSFEAPDGLVLDSANNRVLVFDHDLNALLAVDLSTGARTIFSDNNTPNATNALISTSDLAFDSVNNRVLLLNGFDQKVVLAVDLSTGTRTIVSDVSTPDVTIRFRSATGLVLDSANNRVLVTDWVLQAVLAVDLSTGARTIISDDNTPNATNALTSPQDMALDSVNNRVLVLLVGSHEQAVLAVDLSTGARTIISDNSISDVVSFNDPTGLVLDSANNRVLVTDWGLQAVLAVDLSTGARTIISSTYDHL